MYSPLPYIIIFTLLGFVVIHAYMSMRYGYDWIGNATRKMIVRSGLAKPSTSVTDLFDIPRVPYMDRFEAFTKIPKMKENAY
jgi:hypothetical protein